MKRNVGKTDQVIRMIIGIALLVLFAETDRSLAINWLLLGGAIIMIGTAALSYCPLYQLLGISTSRSNHRGKSASKSSAPTDVIY